MKAKKRFLVFAFATLFGAMICNATMTKDEEPPKTYKPIVVRREPTNFHRSLEAPIYAYYMDGVISLDFIEDLGTAAVSVQNLSTGSQVAEVIDTGAGNVIIDICSIISDGGFYMSITTISGDVYYAEFTLE